MGNSIGIKIKYLDTSSIIKLYLDEEGSTSFRNYFNSNTNFCTALMTFYEVMNVLKSRLFKKDKESYYKALTDLGIQGWRGKIEVEALDLNNGNILREVGILAGDNELDIADAIQIYAILKGKYSHFNRESASVLITADKNQELVALQKGIRVWNCCNAIIPEWLDN